MVRREHQSPVPGARCPRFASVLWTLTWVVEHSRWSAAGFRFPISRCPFRFDLDDSDFSQRIMTKAAPLPVSRFCHQPTLHRIAMQISQLYRELLRIPHVPVVESWPTQYRVVRVRRFPTLQLWLQCRYTQENCRVQNSLLTCSYIKATLWHMPRTKRKARAWSAPKPLKDDVVRMRISAEQKHALTEAAERDGLELSAWLRRLALREAGVLPEAK